MFAYLLILLAVLSRIAVLPHLPWLNFTAVGGSLRSWSNFGRDGNR